MDLARLLAAVENAPPVAAADVLGAWLAEELGASEVAFLVVDFSGRALIRLGHAGARAATRTQGRETAERVSLVDSPNRRFTDLFEWGQRSVRLSLAAEIQHRLLPGAFTCEGGQFTLAAWLEPQARSRVTASTSRSSATRCTCRCPTPAGTRSGRRSWRRCSSARCATRAARASGWKSRRGANEGLGEHVGWSDFVTGQARASTCAVMLERNAANVDLPALMIEGAEMHPREAVQHVALALLHEADGELRDDATAMCVDWHGGPPRARDTDSGADQLT